MSATDREVAEAFGIPSEILPRLADLPADIWVLGSWPDRIVEPLRTLQLPARTTTVLEEETVPAIRLPRRV